MKRFDVVVIGGTQAGLVAADALSAANARVALVRIPGDDDADRLRHAVEGVPVPAEAPVRCDVLAGPAAFVAPDRLSTPEGDVEAARFIIATGAAPAGDWDIGVGPFPRALDALTGPAPASAVVLGSGPTAVVMADRLSRNGCRVTLVSRSPRLLPLEDDSVADALAGALRAQGVEIETGATALGWAPSGVTRWSAGGQAREAKADAIFPETDLRADTAALALPRAGVFADVAGRVVVDEEMRTSRAGIWAAGHATSPGAPLARHIHEAELAAHNATAGVFGRRKAEPALPPVVIRSTPTAARVGLTEAEAKERYRDVVCAAAADAQGQVKIVGRRRGGQLLGAHVVGAGAAEAVIFFDLLLRAAIPVGDAADRRHFPTPGLTDAVYRALSAWSAAG